MYYNNIVIHSVEQHTLKVVLSNTTYTTPLPKPS